MESVFLTALSDSCCSVSSSSTSTLNSRLSDFRVQPWGKKTYVRRVTNLMPALILDNIHKCTKLLEIRGLTLYNSSAPHCFARLANKRAELAPSGDRQVSQIFSLLPPAKNNKWLFVHDNKAVKLIVRTKNLRFVRVSELTKQVHLWSAHIWDIVLHLWSGRWHFRKLAWRTHHRANEKAKTSPKGQKHSSQ